MNKCDKQVYKDKNKLTLDDVIIFLSNPTHVCLCLTVFHFVLSTIQGLSFVIIIIYIFISIRQDNKIIQKRNNEKKKRKLSTYEAVFLFKNGKKGFFQTKERDRKRKSSADLNG